MRTLREVLGREPRDVVREIDEITASLRGLRAEIVCRSTGDPVVRIIEIVGSQMEVSLEEINGRCREQRIALARQMAMVLAKEIMGLSSVQVGKAFGRDHGTVLHAERAIRNACETDPSIAKAKTYAATSVRSYLAEIGYPMPVNTKPLNVHPKPATA